MTDWHLTSSDMMALNAGQCRYATECDRAVALVLAHHARPLDFTGKRGRLTFTPQDTALATIWTWCRDWYGAEPAVIPVWLAYQSLIAQGYIAHRASVGKTLVVEIDTTVLAARVNDLDAPVDEREAAA